MVYKKGTLVRVIGNTKTPRHYILPDTIAVVVEDCDSSKNANAVLLKGRWVKNPKKEIEQHVNVCDFVVLNQKAVIVRNASATRKRYSLRTGCAKLDSVLIGNWKCFAVQQSKYVLHRQKRIIDRKIGYAKKKV